MLLGAAAPHVVIAVEPADAVSNAMSLGIATVLLGLGQGDVGPDGTGFAVVAEADDAVDARFRLVRVARWR